MARSQPDGNSGAAGMSLRARLLGPSELAVGGRQISQREWPGRKARSLLLLLLDTPGHAMSRDQALNLLWPDHDPDAASNALYKAIHAVRRVLEPALQTGRKSRFIELQGDTIALSAGIDLWIDAERMAGLIRRAEIAAPEEQRPLFREALGLVRGEYIADEPYADWLTARRAGIRAEIVRTTLRLARLDLDAGEPLDAVPALEALLALDATLETAHRALMRAYAGAGMRSEALRQFEVCRAQLRQELDEAPEPETEQLAASIRSAFSTPAALDHQTNASLAAASQTVRQVLPSLPTPTVGRQQEIDSLTRLLRDPDVRMVTITGAGGVGKTRIARQLAIEFGQHHSGDVHFVPLVAVREPELALAAIGAALGVAEDPARSWIELLTDRLQQVEMLLVLDNLEQIASVAESLAELVESCPALTLLATSRAPLRIRAEHCFKLDVLSLPASAGVADLRASGAAELFLQIYERLHRNQPGIDGDDRAAIAAICRYLDGLPLAIEIAASHCYERTPRQLWEILSRRTRVSALRDGPRDLPERHRTLADLIAWSYQLLHDDAKRLFRQLAVFSGGIEQDAVIAVAGEDAWRIAGDLADQSLVTWTQVNGVRRLEMLETVREVAQELLEETIDGASARMRHLDFYAEYARQADTAMRGPQQRLWFDRLERDVSNIRAAMSFALADGDASRHAAANTIVTGSWLYWYYRGSVQEAASWLDRLSPVIATSTQARPELRTFYLTQIIAGRRLQDQERINHYLELARAVTSDADTDTAALLLPIQEGILVRQDGDLAGSRDTFLSAMRRADAVGNAWIVAEALQELSTTCQLLGDFDAALAALDQAAGVSHRAGDLLSESNALTYRAVAAFQAGDAALAQRSAHEAEVLCRLVDNRSLLPWTLYVQAADAFSSGQFRRAIAMLVELRQLFMELGNPRNRASVDVSLGACFAADGDLPAARVAFQQAIPATIRFGFSEDQTMCLIEAGLFAAAADRAEMAVMLLAASAAHASRIGQVINAPDEARQSSALDTLRAALSQTAFDAAWNAGQHLTLDDAFTLALQIGPEPLQCAS